MKVSAIIKGVITLALILLLALPTNAVFASQPISVTIDGERVNFTGQQPVIVGGRTLVPVRGVFEQLGFQVEWDDELQAVIMSRPEQRVRIGINQPAFTVFTVSTDLTIFYPLDVPAQIINGSMMLPIRAVVEAVGYWMGWDSATQTVQIFTEFQPPPLKRHSTPQFPTPTAAQLPHIATQSSIILPSNRRLTEAELQEWIDDVLI